MSSEINDKKENKKEDWEIPVPEYDYCGPMGKDSIDYTHRVIINNRYFQIFIAILILILIFLSVGYFRLSNNLTMIVKMPNYGEIKIARMQADSLYYRVWGDYILNYIANFNPTNIKDHIEKSLVVFDRDVLIEKKLQFEAYYQSIKTNRITQTFKFNDQKVKIDIEDSGGGANVIFDGVATQSISDLAIRKKSCYYEMHFIINDGEIVQDSLKTNCLDDNTIIPKKEKEIQEDAKPGKKELDFETKNIKPIGIDTEDDGMIELKDSDKNKAIVKPVSKTEVSAEDYKIKIDNNYIMQDLKNQKEPSSRSEVEDKSSEKEIEKSSEKKYNHQDYKKELEKKLNTQEKATYE